MNHLLADSYKSPSRYRVLNRLENKLLSADDSWWTGRKPLHTRMVAEVPRALYLNFLVKKSYVAGLGPRLFRPLDLPNNEDVTLFTVLLFTLERARPMWAPRLLGALAPRVMQSNWRFYGHITEPGRESRDGVLFIRTVTTSLMLSAFGRRIARCFPLRRAECMALRWTDGHLKALIHPGVGSAPELMFEGEQTNSAVVSDVFQQQFLSYESYAHWVIDQHLSVTIWPKEHVVQDMHLDFKDAKIVPVRRVNCRISGIKDFVSDESTPLDCFIVEGLNVFLDSIYAVPD